MKKIISFIFFLLIISPAQCLADDLIDTIRNECAKIIADIENIYFWKNAEELGFNKDIKDLNICLDVYTKLGGSIETIKKNYVLAQMARDHYNRGHNFFSKCTKANETKLTKDRYNKTISKEEKTSIYKRCLLDERFTFINIIAYGKPLNNTVKDYISPLYYQAIASLKNDN